MSRVSVFIDGFNLYHALNSNQKYHKYKWLDYRRLASRYILGRDQLTEVVLFTAFAHWVPDKVASHKEYLKAAEFFGTRFILGSFRKKYPFCQNCNTRYETYEEKLTDVNIAIHMLDGAHRNLYDKAVIISGDADISPAIRMITSLKPEKEIGVVIPIGRRAEELKSCCHYHFKMTETQLAESQLPDVIFHPDGTTLNRPQTWA